MRPAVRNGALLLACALVAGPPDRGQAEPDAPYPDGGEVRTALLSFPDFFCAFTELSAPYAHIGFAIRLEDRIRYFKTIGTDCGNVRASRGGGTEVPVHLPVFGEQVTLYGGAVPTRLRRESGDVYDIEPSETSTTRSFFLPSVAHTGYESPGDLPVNPHPDLVLPECRLLTEAAERDLCLWYQAGLQDDEGICDGLSRSRRQRCRTWLDNIRGGRINR
jgi:hypothetical protein